jgi:hypothetical protein
VTNLSFEQVRGWRLQRHHLLARAGRDQALDVVGDVLGVHAQVMSAAELTLGARLDGIGPQLVRDLLWEDRALVKTWCMRGTLHLLPAREYPLWAAALSGRTHWELAPWLKFHGITQNEMQYVIRAVTGALDGHGVTREELAARVGQDLGTHLREKLLEGWGSLLKPVAYAGQLCFGPNRGRNVTFVRPDHWLGTASRSRVGSRQEAPDPDEALKQIARRYLHAYGPASHQNFVQWWGTSQARARVLFASIGEELAGVRTEGQTAWALSDDLEAMLAAPDPRSVRLLPGFDAYTVGFQPRSALVADRFKDRVFRTAGWISPVLLVDGAVAGVWELQTKGGAATATVRPFGRLRPGARREMRNEVERLSEFLQRPVRLTYSR